MNFILFVVLIHPWLNSIMENKGFETEQIMLETPDTLDASERPLKSNESKPQRVDINILKSKLKKNEDKQFKKNLAVFISFLAGLSALGIYLST